MLVLVQVPKAEEKPLESGLKVQYWMSRRPVLLHTTIDRSMHAGEGAGMFVVDPLLPSSPLAATPRDTKQVCGEVQVVR